MSQWSDAQWRDWRQGQSWRPSGSRASSVSQAPRQARSERFQKEVKQQLDAVRASVEARGSAFASSPPAQEQQASAKPQPAQQRAEPPHADPVDPAVESAASMSESQKDVARLKKAAAAHIKTLMAARASAKSKALQEAIDE